MKKIKILLLLTAVSFIAMSYAKSNIEPVKTDPDHALIDKVCDEVATQYGEQFDMSFEEETDWYWSCVDANL